MKVFPSGHVLRSQPSGERKTGAFGDRLTPWPSCSSFALLFLLAVWSFCTKDDCGFTRDCDKRRAYVLLVGFVTPFLGTCRTLPVFLGAWHHQWPRPDQGTWLAKIPVRESKVGLVVLRKTYIQMSSYGLKRLEALKKNFYSLEWVPVFEFVEFLACHLALFSNVFAQVMLALGLELDTTIGEAYISGRKKVGQGFEITWEALEQSTNYALDNLLFRYSEAYQALVNRLAPQRYSFACDKSRVHGIPMQNMLLCICNFAWWPPPQDLVSPPRSIYIGIGF